MDRPRDGVGRRLRPAENRLGSFNLSGMSRSFYFWFGVACACGALVGALDPVLHLSYGVELVLTGIVVAATLNLSHRFARVPR